VSLTPLARRRARGTGCERRAAGWRVPAVRLSRPCSLNSSSAGNVPPLAPSVRGAPLASYGLVAHFPSYSPVVVVVVVAHVFEQRLTRLAYVLVRVCLRDVCLPSACRPRACLRRPRRCASSSRRSCSIGSSWARRPSTMRCVTAALTSQRLCTSSTDSEARWAHTWMRSSSWRLCPILTPRRSTTWERACPTSSPRCAPRSRRLVTFGAWSGR